MMLKLGKWNVRIVNTGDNYGRAMCLTNDKAPMVEFYDNSRPDIQYGAYGQFISRYYIYTILSQDSRGGEYSNGLCLDGRVLGWYVSAEDMAQVLTFLKEHNANT